MSIREREFLFDRSRSNFQVFYLLSFFLVSVQHEKNRHFAVLTRERKQKRETGPGRFTEDWTPFGVFIYFSLSAKFTLIGLCRFGRWSGDAPYKAGMTSFHRSKGNKQNASRISLFPSISKQISNFTLLCFFPKSTRFTGSKHLDEERVSLTVLISNNPSNLHLQAHRRCLVPNKVDPADSLTGKKSTRPPLRIDLIEILIHIPNHILSLIFMIFSTSLRKSNFD